MITSRRISSMAALERTARRSTVGRKRLYPGTEMNKNNFGSLDLFFDIEKLPTHGPNSFHWSWHEFDYWQDGSYSETQGVGYHITKWKIVKGNYTASMREELFYVGDSFAIRPIELITLERRDGYSKQSEASPKLEG